MIYVVIGQSGAGKTTFVKKHFLTGAMELIEKKYPVPVTKCGDVFAIGRYGIGIRTEGTDTTARNALPKIIQTVRRLVEEKKSVLMEGDRINNDAMFQFLATLGVPVRLYLLTCPIATSLARLREAGSKITGTFVQCTRTKAMRRFLKWGNRFNGQVIDTDGNDG